MERDILKWHNPVKGRLTFVAATPKANLAVACVGYIADDKDSTLAECVHLSVDPEMRRFGVASKLGRVMIEHAAKEGKEKMHLGTTVSHQSAIRFYEKCGFKLKATRNKFFGSMLHCVRICEFVMDLKIR